MNEAPIHVFSSNMHDMCCCCCLSCDVRSTLRCFPCQLNLLLQHIIVPREPCCKPARTEALVSRCLNESKEKLYQQEVFCEMTALGLVHEDHAYNFDKCRDRYGHIFLFFFPRKIIWTESDLLDNCGKRV